MSTTAKNPEITPIPVQLSESEFNAFIFPHLSMPTRGPKCKLGGRVSDLYLDMQSEPKFIPIDKQPDDDVMHLNRFGKTDRLTS
jgi:hypothetical protein